MKMFLIAGALFILCSLTFYGVNTLKPSKSARSSITIGFPGAWGSLEPPSQHTMLGDAILGNQFEPLVDMERGGMIVPFAARSWKVSHDYRKYTFKIDPSRKFSDGSRLTAMDFKRSWEEGFKIQSKLAMKSMMDVLYKIEGVDKFSERGEISGLQVIDDETFEVNFSTPFRIALDHLTGSRFAAFKIVNGKYIGTGPYVIEESNVDKVTLKKNPFAKLPGMDTVFVVSKPAQQCESDIKNGLIDVYAFAGRLSYSGPCHNEEIGCIEGFEAAHNVALVNGLPGRIFEDPTLRLALQYILTQENMGINPAGMFPDGILLNKEIDPQPFLNLQAGRLPNKEAFEIIAEGKNQIDKLVNASKKRPLVLVYGKGSIVADVVMKILNGYGVKIGRQLETLSTGETQQIMNVKKEADIALIRSSVVDGDPDGIYHALGKNGAIASEMTLRPRVSQLLEEGREIQDITKLDEHYRKVSVAILSEVPWVHFGFLLEKTVYRADRLNVNFRHIKSRIREPFSIFEVK